MSLRPEHALIAEWIRPGSRVLDLGCGDGTLLAHLQATRKATGYGLEIDPDNVACCISTGVQVIQYDLNSGLSAFGNKDFDYVIMTQTLQAVRYPHLLLGEMLRVGREGIVTFPNLGHWRCRLRLWTGQAPRLRVGGTAPPWYASDSIHPCTVRDFERLCARDQLRILQRSTMDRAHHARTGMSILPNLLGEIAIYRLQRSTS